GRDWATTDERGVFRMRVLPGKYNLKAGSDGQPFGSGMPEIRPDGTHAPIYGPTYSPNATSKSAAAVVEAKPGAEAADMDIHLAHSAAKTLTVGGVVTGIPNNAGAMVWLQKMEKGQVTMNRLQPAYHGAKFALARVTPGVYRIFAQCNVGDEVLRSPSVDL